MSYVYRADEDIDRLPVAPYVLREEEHFVDLPFISDKCGTPAGYQQHRRHGRPACDECKAAVAKAEAWYQARRQSQQRNN